MGDPNVVCTIGADGDRVAYGENTRGPSDLSAASDESSASGSRRQRGASLAAKAVVACDLDCACGGEIEIDCREDLTQPG
jgi:hypothetical protein